MRRFYIKLVPLPLSRCHLLQSSRQHNAPVKHHGHDGGQEIAGKTRAGASCASTAVNTASPGELPTTNIWVCNGSKLDCGTWGNDAAISRSIWCSRVRHEGSPFLRLRCRSRNFWCGGNDRLGLRVPLLNDLCSCMNMILRPILRRPGETFVQVYFMYHFIRICSYIYIRPRGRDARHKMLKTSYPASNRRPDSCWRHG